MRAQRELLDTLLGKNRNGDAPEESGKMTWSDDRVCKFYLCGLCPESLFTNTRHDLGGCKRTHSDELRAEYQRDAAAGNATRTGFEEALERRLLQLLEENRRRISRAHQRLEATTRGAPVLAPKDAAAAAEMERLAAEITSLHDAAELLGEEGKVDESKATFEKAELLRARQAQLLSTGARGLEGQQQALRVCETCGSYLSLLESDRGLVDHFGGKLHQGMRRIIDMYNAIQDRKPASRRRAISAQTYGTGTSAPAPAAAAGADDRIPRLPPAPRSRSPSRSRSRSPRREREDSRDRDRDYHGSRERHHHHYHHRHHHHEHRSGSRETAGGGDSHFDGDHSDVLREFSGPYDH